MSESRCIAIQNEADVINARLQTRRMATEAGLSTMDQARISLAVSSLAHIIRLGDCYKGQVVLNRIVDVNRSGVQVIWKIGSDCNVETVLKDLSNSTMQGMVQDLKSEVTESGISISAMIWTPIAAPLPAFANREEHNGYE